MSTQAWLQAFRLRTLPLALSSIFMGVIISFIHHNLNWKVSIWAVITTVLLQILSNLANDYGDGIKGTDNNNRLGPKRTVQSGAISPLQMKTAIIIVSIIAFFSGLLLIWYSEIDFAYAIGFILLGIAAIASAIYYTVGKKAYGYSGFGDLFVFLFFGLIAVLGTFYLNTGFLVLEVIFPAITVGLFSVAVLNLNNIRDFDNDRNNRKNTIVVKIGIKKAKLYQTIIINLAFFSLLLYVNLVHLSWQVYLVFLLYPLFMIDLMKIDKEKDLKKLDPFLKKTALKTFLLVIVFGILVNFFS